MLSDGIGAGNFWIDLVALDSSLQQVRVVYDVRPVRG